MSFILPPLDEEFSKQSDSKKFSTSRDEAFSYLSEYFGGPTNTEYFVNTFAQDGWTGFHNLDFILSFGIELDASDVHLQPGQPVCFTIAKEIYKIDEFAPTNRDTLLDMSEGILSHQQNNIYIRDRDYDSAYRVRFGPHKGRRMRVNLGRSFNDTTLTFRIIPDRIPTLEQLNVPEELVKWSKLVSGVWIVGGSTGSGKTTTLASIIHNLQMTTKKKIVTIEKPIEYVYDTSEGTALIIQRDVGSDTLSFGNGLTAAMRQNPDIILIGEVRDATEVGELLRAAETGHLAISTIHTNSVYTTINRILSLFSDREHERIKSTLADTVRGLCNQLLIRDLDGKLFAIHEVLDMTPEVSNYIRNGQIHLIKEYMASRGDLMEQKLIQAYKDGKCSLKDARDLAPDQVFFDAQLR